VFQFEFVLPKNIAYEINPGKLSLYADDLVTGRDAKGASGAFKIGGSEPNPTPDAQGPLVSAFMGDSTFTNGGKVLPNTTLVVRLFDEGGINISNYGIGNTLVAILDDNQEIYLLNEHFISDTNTYGSGWVYYPIYDLPPGKHTLTIKAWDTSNNPGEGRVDFVVSDKGLLEIDSFWAFPNPSNSTTTFFFRHNRSGDDLQAEVTILSASGLEVQKLRLLSASSPHEIQIPVEEAETLLGKKLPSGVYFARLSVRSITDGSKSERVTKLIIVN
jgi:hypothetical protein